MIEFINNLTGSKMFVSEDRKEEYMKLGHKLVAPKKKPVRKKKVDKK